MDNKNNADFTNIQNLIKNFSLDEKLKLLEIPAITQDQKALAQLIIIDLENNHKDDWRVNDLLATSYSSVANKSHSQQYETKPKSSKKNVLSTLFSWFYSIFGWLIILIVLSTLTSPGKIYQWIKPFENPLRFFAFSISVSILFSLVASVIIKSHKPSGNNIDKSHIWVFENSKSKAKDATERDLFEHTHGYGSWAEKINSDRKSISALLLIITSVSPILVDRLLGYRESIINSSNLMLYTIAPVIISGIIFIFIQTVLHSTQYQLPKYNNPTQPINLDINIKTTITLLIFLLAGGFSIIGSLWVYISHPVFIISEPSFGKSFFIYSTIIILLVPVFMFFLFLNEKIKK